tara:strand:+ start:1898 stop:2185 length:288 start_codon:yes stop_codon:yes gene_type:complete
MTEKQETTTTEENPLLALPSKEKESDLKNYLIDFTGTFLEEENVTVNMIAEVLAAEFPEFTFAFAEENFIRGYESGLNDAYASFKTKDAPANENK